MRRLIRSRLIWISTVCKWMSEFTWCTKLPEFTLVKHTHCTIKNNDVYLEADRGPLADETRDCDLSEPPLPVRSFPVLLRLCGLFIPAVILCVTDILTTVKPVLSGHSKIDKTKFLKTNGSLMKDRKHGQKYCRMLQESILQYFWPALSDNRSWKPILVFFWSGRLRQVLLYLFPVLDNSRTPVKAPVVIFFFHAQLNWAWNFNCS